MRRYPWNPEGTVRGTNAPAPLFLPWPNCGAMMLRLAILLTVTVFLLSLIGAPLQSGGWLWDTGNACGFLAYAGLLYLYLDVGSGLRGRIHQRVSYAVAVLLVGHVGVLWVPDETIWHYVGFSAPAYMVAGVGAAGLTQVMILLALPGTRRWWHLRHPQFQRWHYWLALVVLVTACWHMIGSGFYIEPLEACLYVLLTAAVVVGHRLRHLPRPQAAHALLAAPLIALAFVGIKGLAA